MPYRTARRRCARSPGPARGSGWRRKPASVAVHTRGRDPRRRRAGHRRGPQRSGHLATASRSPPGKEVIELSVVADRQGHRRRRAADPALGQRGACSRRRRHRRERLRQPARARPRHQDRSSGDTEGPLPGRRRRSRPPACWRCCCETRRHWLFGERAVPIERHSMLSNGAHRRAADPGGQGHLAVPPEAGLGGDLRRPGRRQPRPGHFTRRPRSAAASRSASATARHHDRGDPLVGADGHRLARPPPRPPTARPSHRRLDPGPGAVRLAGPGSSSRPGPSSARCHPAAADRRRACWCSAPTSRSCSTPPASTWEISSDGAQRPGPGDGRPQRVRRQRHAGAALRAPTRAPAAGAASTSGRLTAEAAWRDWSAALRLPSIARDLVAAQRAHAARAVPRADRRDPGRGDHLAARGDRRRPQLGLPVLLAARRVDDRHRPWSTSAPPRRPSRCCGWTLDGSSTTPTGTRSGCTRCTPSTAPNSAPRRSSRRCPGYAGLPPGAGRQRRQRPGAARRVRSGRRPDRRPRRRSGPAARPSDVALMESDGRGGRAAAGTSPTTASGRPAGRPGTTSTRR